MTLNGRYTIKPKQKKNPIILVYVYKKDLVLRKRQWSIWQ